MLDLRPPRLLQEITQQGRKAEVFQADIASSDAVKGLFEHLQKKFGRLDILVNNAGMIRDNLLLSTELSASSATESYPA